MRIRRTLFVCGLIGTVIAFAPASVHAAPQELTEDAAVQTAETVSETGEGSVDAVTEEQAVVQNDTVSIGSGKDLAPSGTTEAGPSSDSGSGKNFTDEEMREYKKRTESPKAEVHETADDSEIRAEIVSVVNENDFIIFSIRNDSVSTMIGGYPKALKEIAKNALETHEFAEPRFAEALRIFADAAVYEKGERDESNWEGDGPVAGNANRILAGKKPGRHD